MLSLKITKNEINKDKNMGLTGLQNLGNTCWMNSILQCLSNTYFLKQIFLNKEEQWKKHINRDKKESEFVISFYKLFDGMWKQNCTVRPVTMEQLISKNCKNFIQYGQHDAHEALIILIDKLHTGFVKQVNISISGKPKNKIEKMQIQSYNDFKKRYKQDYSVILDIFFGTTVSEIKSKTGESHNFTSFSTLELEIPDTPGPLSIIDCLDHYTKIEKLDGENKWYNEDNNTYENADKRISIFKQPNVLILILKRFLPTGFKNRKNVSFSHDLDIAKYMYDQSLIEDTTKYKLYSICNHVGDINGGHYTSCCLNQNGNWYHYDDTVITPINNISLMNNNQVYILFYVKKNAYNYNV